MGGKSEFGEQRDLRGNLFVSCRVAERIVRLHAGVGEVWVEFLGEKERELRIVLLLQSLRNGCAGASDGRDGGGAPLADDGSDVTTRLWNVSARSIRPQFPSRSLHRPPLLWESAGAKEGLD